MSVEQLADLIFTNNNNIIQALAEEDDNEMIFEILLDVVKAGLIRRRLIFPSLQHTQVVDWINSKLIYAGFRVHVSMEPYENGPKLIHYCSINNQEFLLNPFHPYRLMEEMSVPPKCYQKYFQRREFLHQVCAVMRLSNGIMTIRFAPINIITV